MSSPHRRLGIGLAVLAVGLALNAVLGPLWVGAIEYRFSDSLIDQAIGLDAVILFGTVPVAVAAAVLCLRGHRIGPVLAFVPTTFAVYMLPQYVIGPEYLDLPGNNERLFPFHLGMFVLALGLLLSAWRSIDRGDLRPRSYRSDRRRSLVLVGVVAFIGLRWVPFLIDVVGGSPTVPDYLENPTSFMLIGWLDLGFVVPAAIATSVALLRGTGWARQAAYAIIGWFTLVPASVAAMSIVMYANDDPNTEIGAVVVFSVAAVVFLAGAVALYRPMLREPWTPVPADDEDADIPIAAI